MFFTGRPWIASRTASSTTLPLIVRGISGTCRIRAGTWRGVVFARICRRMRSRERVVEDESVAQPHEQDDADVVPHLLADDDALEHLRQPLDLPVDLGRADADAARVQHGVGAAEDHEASARRHEGVVAVVPDAAKALEVGRAVAGAAGVVPEPERHRRERGGADELAFLLDDRPPFVVPDLHLHAEPAALQLAAIHGKERVAEREAGNDVRAPGDRGELHVGTDGRGDEVVLFRPER